jgi:putative oxidoreductase
MRDLGLLMLRLTAGGLLAGHGAQKLFGSFGGHGLKGTAGWLESMGHKPGHPWAMMAGLSEFGGGTLTALGLGGPIGPITTLGPMGMATGTVHWGKPIWATSGGAELPVINMSVASALALAGPGRFSLDHALGIRVPGWLAALALAGTLGGLYIGLATREQPAAQEEPTAPTTETPTEAEHEEPIPLLADQDIPRAA